MSTSHDTKPWYAREKKKTFLSSNKENLKFLDTFFKFLLQSIRAFNLFRYGFLSIVFSSFASIILVKLLQEDSLSLQVPVMLLGILMFVMGAIYLMLAQIGSVCVFFDDSTAKTPKYKVGYLYLVSQLAKSKPRINISAPELVLKQFVQQVRFYSLEKNYFLQKQNLKTEDTPSSLSLLDRRWHDVQDTLDEFDVYLSQNSTARIEVLLSTLTPQTQDAAQLFQNIAETFEMTWRPKGITIEHAIVVPLKITLNEKLLKRLLAGAWRATVYFAPKGGTVTFSSKSENGKVYARWACLGVTFASDFYETVCNRNLSLNARIEIGMTYISNQPQNSTILFGLISLLIWHDLAIAANVNFNIKQDNDGMIATLVL